MARILYGVAGEGSGHSSRTKEISRFLLSEGHEVLIVSSGKGYKNLKPYFKTELIGGLRFTLKKNQVKYIQTVFNNFLSTPESIKSINRCLKIIDNFKPQLVFTDFEPFSGIAANLKKLPLISVDNQHRLTNAFIDYPKKYETQALAAKAVIRLFIIKAKVYLVTDFIQVKIKNKNTFLFPPILRQEVREAKTNKKDHFVVYLSAQFRGMLGILKRISEKFIIYGFDEQRKEGNLTFKKPSQTDFLSDLANSKGVIANAGFTLITEGIYLGKPYLAVPIKGQFEQTYNAYNLEKLGYGKFWEELNQEKVESFLFNLNKYELNLKKYKKEDNKKIFRKIKSIINKYS